MYEIDMTKPMGEIWEELLNIPFKEENTVTLLGVRIPIPSPPRILFRDKQFESGFVGNNLTLKEYESLNETEKMKLQSILLERNGNWLNQKFQELNAVWITVVDGEIETFSSDIDKYPNETDLLEICRKKDKFPFIFINQGLLAIEENSSNWSKTVYSDDYYPTAKILIDSSNSSLKIAADFDTGTSEIYMDMARLISEGLISKPSSIEVPQRGDHLSKTYWYYVRSLSIGLVSERGNIKKEKVFSVFCVRDWGISPFVKINKFRDVLVGRRLFLKLKPSVVLKFNDQKTEIYF